MKKYILLLFMLSWICSEQDLYGQAKDSLTETKPQVKLVILGTIQDAGSPQIGCKKSCCSTLDENEKSVRKVVSLGLIDEYAQKTFLFEASPDIVDQCSILKSCSPFIQNELPNGIFITHAHIGHYTGLMYLGKEAINANKVDVFSMPKLKKYLESSGPWSLLVDNENINLVPLHDHKQVQLSDGVQVIPLLVPHRDEFSETVGYKILGPKKSVLFIPDIDKWSKWHIDIRQLIKEVDYAFIDGTFYDGVEINFRDISLIPHPFIIESMDLFNELSNTQKSKIHFIHFNHTNPLLIESSTAHQKVLNQGFNIAQFKDEYILD